MSVPVSVVLVRLFLPSLEHGPTLEIHGLGEASRRDRRPIFGFGRVPGARSLTSAGENANVHNHQSQPVVTN